jgi:hypothetical protein
LAFELRQNNKLLETQARATQTATRLAHNDRLLAPENSALIVKARSGDELTEDERFRYERLMHALFVSWESDYREFREGFIENMTIEGMRRSFNTYAGLRETWRSRKNVYNDDFVAFVEDQVLDGLTE